MAVFEDKSTPSASRGLAPISQQPLQVLVGYQAAFYLPQEDLLAEPRVIAGAIDADLQLAPGAGWRPLPVTQGTLKLVEDGKLTKGSTTYPVKVTAKRPQPTPAVLAALAGLERRRLLLLVQEQGGALRLVGGKEEFVRLVTSTEGQNPATRAGVDLELAGETTRLAPYYRGAVPLIGGGTVAGSGRTINVRDTAGTLLLVVPVGSELIVSCPFQVDLTVR